MKLSQLIRNLDATKIFGSTDICISSVEYDSARVHSGSLFVCIKGFNADGHAYLADAVARGAAAVVVEDICREDIGATVLCVPDSRRALALISSEWFGRPSDKLTLIGITGTKGKTTTAYMTKQILEQAGFKVGMIGTMGSFIGAEHIETRNTTPESFELHAFFSKMLDAGCTHAVMEASSQGFKLHRTAGLKFKIGAFLNLSPDHISPTEHKSFEEYRDCKKMLFSQSERAIANADSEYCEYMIGKNDVLTFSVERNASIRAAGVCALWNDSVLGSRFNVSGFYGGEVVLNMPGVFNVQNALAAMCIAHALGVDFNTARASLERTMVKGRAQPVRTPTHAGTFIIDYAHNALSIAALVKMLREYSPKRLILVFGCGGERSAQRRYDLGLIAGGGADLCILTSDNTRFDDIDIIISQIVRGVREGGGRYQIIKDRKDAIHYAMDICQEGDIVAFVGKGHEEYQDIRGTKYYFSEEKIIKEYAATKK